MQGGLQFLGLDAEGLLLLRQDGCLFLLVQEPVRCESHTGKVRSLDPRKASMEKSLQKKLSSVLAKWTPCMPQANILENGPGILENDS